MLRFSSWQTNDNGRENWGTGQCFEIIEVDATRELSDGNFGGGHEMNLKMKQRVETIWENKERKKNTKGTE